MKLCKEHEDELIKLKDYLLDNVKKINLLLNADLTSAEVSEVSETIKDMIIRLK